MQHSPLQAGARPGSGARRGLRLIAGALLLAAAALALPEQAPAQTADQRIQTARDLTIRGEWAQALTIFREIADATGTPGARAAEASFFTGFCLEHLEGRDAEAWQVYQDTRTKYPSSPFARRALLRQIPLAGLLGASVTTYREFLVEQVSSESEGVRKQAALSLGRLGDERAVPVLQEMMASTSSDDKMLALEVVENYEPDVAGRILSASARGMTAGAAPDPVTRQAARIQENLNAQKAERARMEELLASDKRLLMETIKRQGEEWTQEELITHGLLHVMEPQMFASYVQADEAERKQLYDQFFRLLGDPIPQTPERNELEEEFRRRVEVAHDLYSEPWQAARSRYDAKEWLTPDNPYAPWDARGELLIRYGEPTDIHLVGFNIEEWVYGGMRVDFTVHLYKMNWLLNAIYPGRASQQDYPAGHVQATYINTPRLEFRPGGRR